jgi:hypothetical protein
MYLSFIEENIIAKINVKQAIDYFYYLRNSMACFALERGSDITIRRP